MKAEPVVLTAFEEIARKLCADLSVDEAERMRPRIAAALQRVEIETHGVVAAALDWAEQDGETTADVVLMDECSKLLKARGRG